MRFILNSLKLMLRNDEVLIPFADITYFWGQMGAGKSSIARLIDYCLGGDIQLSPALQNEFVSATLSVSLSKASLTIERDRESDVVIARWKEANSEEMQLALPARDARDEKLPGVAVLSDLIFLLSGVHPPRVRRSKIRQDSETGRLSIRDLLWYCYLDQDEIDSSFFHLDERANPFKRLKSRDVIRYVVGFHDEHVAELEAELDQLRGQRLAMIASIESLNRVLNEVGVGTEQQIQESILILQQRERAIRAEIAAMKNAPKYEYTLHSADSLRSEAHLLSIALGKIDSAIDDIVQAHKRDTRFLNELETLSLKFRRSTAARSVLSSVAFSSCPRCAQTLPSRATGCCTLCGQSDTDDNANSTEVAVVERDIKARTNELRDILLKYGQRLEGLRRERSEIATRKARIERERNEALQEYDSAYLSGMLMKEKERASLIQQTTDLEGMKRLPKMLEVQETDLGRLQAREAKLRGELKQAKEAAVRDNANLKRLSDLFLDCLIRSGVPGITGRDHVVISDRDLYPAVRGPSAEDTTVTSFATLSSGGKKTLFKCCFAIAVHRLATELGAPLPSLLIIDSPMKNISERENREQFEGFYDLVYSLKQGELRDTQFVLIDKEFFGGRQDRGLAVVARHMRPGDSKNPPLIPNYNGK